MRETELRRVPELDGLRGLAVLAVLIWHCVGGALDLDQAWARWILNALNLTWTGVDLFFVLSGFLIGGIMLDHCNASNFFKVFYARRTLRIFPIYYVVVLTYVLALGGGLARHHPVIQPLLEPQAPLWSYFTFTQNFLFAHSGNGGAPWLRVTWSLAVEEQFYLCLPFVIFMVPRKRLGQVLAGLILSVPLLRVGLYDLPPRPGFAGYLLMPARADALLLGTLAAWLGRHEPTRGWLSANVRLLRAALAVLFLGTVALHQWRIDYISLGMLTWGYTWIAVFYCCLMLVAIHEKEGLVTWVTRNKALRYLGRISYGVYLLHQIVHGLAHGLILNQAPILRTWTDASVTGLAIAATLALAALSWHWFEQPLVELGHRLKYARQG